MMLVEAMDEGPLLSQADYNIKPDETTPSLTQNLIELSHGLLVSAVPRYITGEIAPQPQTETASIMVGTIEPTYSHKLSKEDGVIDWQKPAEQIEREIRAYLEWPKSRVKLGNIDVVITAAEVVDTQIGQPGKVVVEGMNLLIACGQGALRLKALKPAGKQEMPAQAFLAGYKNRLTV
jgi:methionyl-tRNA formyltransferase